MNKEINDRRYLALILFALVVFSANLFSGCRLLYPEPDPPSVTPANGGSGDCRAACDNLARLGCDGAEGSPGPDDVYGTADDVPCTAVCEDITTDDTVTLYQRCTAAALSCEAVDRCFEVN